MTSPRPGASTPPASPLRIGIVIEALEGAPSWIHRVITGVIASANLKLALVVVSPPLHAARTTRASSGTLLWRVYTAVDARRAGNNALAPMDLRTLCRDVHTIHVHLSVTSCARRNPEASREAIRDARLDVLLDLRFGANGAGLAELATYGVWTFHPSATSQRAGERAAFWEIHQGSLVGGARLELMSEDRRLLLYRSFFSASRSSAATKISVAYWKLADIALRRLESLYEHRGWDYLTRVALIHGQAADSAPIAPTGTPDNIVMAQFLGKLLLRFALMKVRGTVLTREWFMAFRSRTWRHLSERPSTGFRPVVAPRDRFYADPLLFEKDGATYVFFEDYRYGSERGCISCAPVLADGQMGLATPVLDGPYHFSYPFVFEENGEIYLLPETSHNRSLELYRAVDFPREWTLHKILMRDCRLVDGTIFNHAGKHWLFANIKVDGASDWDDLHLFYADSLLGTWVPHPLNPVVADVRRARPAGGLFWDDGALIRPAQDCAAMYGHAITLNRVDALSVDDYRETPLSRIPASWLKFNIGTHTLSCGRTIEAIDGRRWVLKPRLAGLACRLSRIPWIAGRAVST
jgi:hypothetical protein